MRGILLLSLLTLFSHQVLAKKASFFIEKKLFLGGYDPVSYLQSEKAVKGNKNITHLHEGVKILFSSSENKNAFIKDPKKYIPAYNGWCAYAMANDGSLVESNPKYFKIVDGRVFLFYKTFFINTLRSWNKKKNEKKAIEMADKEWGTKYN